MLIEAIETFKNKNELLFWFGFANALTFAFLVVLSFISTIEFAGTNTWHKPIKFALSTWILSWTLVWYSAYLPSSKDLQVVNLLIVFTLSFEVIYITFQASKGEASHFNDSSTLSSILFTLMGLAASIATLCVGYYGIKLLNVSNLTLPDYYIRSIIIGITIFVIAAFTGFAIGRNPPYIPEITSAIQRIPFLHWSLNGLDPRIPHFFGMHAIQIIPLFTWLFIRNNSGMIVFTSLYTAIFIALFILSISSSHY